MSEPGYSKEQLEAAVERLSEPERFREAEQIVASVAPELQSVLVTALGSGGWFGESHQSETLKAATMPDQDQRLTAIRALLTEETHMGMMVGVAVGWALSQELDRQATTASEQGED
ncbi:MAG: hypothetical protein KDB62_09530 [Solirubrobacterales bacterium]|jgi:hypothetical protein|nr:hypothetical protein [Solirubrobacterales bacterium]